VRLIQLEMLVDQNRSDGGAAIVELCSLNMAANDQPDTPFGDAVSPNSSCSDIKAEIRANNSQICHYSSKL